MVLCVSKKLKTVTVRSLAEKEKKRKKKNRRGGNKINKLKKKIATPLRKSFTALPWVRQRDTPPGKRWRRRKGWI